MSDVATLRWARTVGVWQWDCELCPTFGVAPVAGQAATAINEHVDRQHLPPEPDRPQREQRVWERIQAEIGEGL